MDGGKGAKSLDRHKNKALIQPEINLHVGTPEWELILSLAATKMTVQAGTSGTSQAQGCDESTGTC